MPTQQLTPPPRRIFNKHHLDAPPDAIYVGRGSPFGNPFAIGDPSPVSGDPMNRAEAVALHEDWLRSQPALLARIRRNLAGRPLVCFCYPAPCHAETLAQIANDPACECCGTTAFEVAVDETSRLCLYCQPCPSCGVMGSACEDSLGSSGCA